MSDENSSIPKERRSEDDSSFSGTDRRKLVYGVLYNCYGAVGEVEDWLDDHCEGDFSLVIDELDDDLIRKALKIMFSDEADKKRFINEYAKKN